MDFLSIMFWFSLFVLKLSIQALQIQPSRNFVFKSGRSERLLGCSKCQNFWKSLLPQVFSMPFNLKNIEMPKKFQKIEFKGWHRAPLVLLYSVSIQIRSFELLAHFWPLNHFKNPWKRYTSFRTCRSLFVAFYSIKFGQPGAKLEVRMQILCIKNYEKIRVFDYLAFRTNLCHKNSSQSHPNSTDSSGHVKVWSWSFTASNLVNLRQN